MGFVNFKELIENDVYFDIVDPDVPKMFTGKVKQNTEGYICYFEPVQTAKNKNWFDALKVYTIQFFDDKPNHRLKFM